MPTNKDFTKQNKLGQPEKLTDQDRQLINDKISKYSTENLVNIKDIFKKQDSPSSPFIAFQSQDQNENSIMKSNPKMEKEEAINNHNELNQEQVINSSIIEQNLLPLDIDQGQNLLISPKVNESNSFLDSESNYLIFSRKKDLKKFEFFNRVNGFDSTFEFIKEKVFYNQKFDFVLSMDSQFLSSHIFTKDIQGIILTKMSCRTEIAKFLKIMIKQMITKRKNNYILRISTLGDEIIIQIQKYKNFKRKKEKENSEIDSSKILFIENLMESEKIVLLPSIAKIIHEKSSISDNHFCEINLETCPNPEFASSMFNGRNVEIYEIESGNSNKKLESINLITESTINSNEQLEKSSIFIDKKLSKKTFKMMKLKLDSNFESLNFVIIPDCLAKHQKIFDDRSIISKFSISGTNIIDQIFIVIKVNLHPYHTIMINVSRKNDDLEATITCYDPLKGIDHFSEIESLKTNLQELTIGGI